MVLLSLLCSIFSFWVLLQSVYHTESAPAAPRVVVLRYSLPADVFRPLAVANLAQQAAFFIFATSLSRTLIKTILHHAQLDDARTNVLKNAASIHLIPPVTVQ